MHAFISLLTAGWAVAIAPPAITSAVVVDRVVAVVEDDMISLRELEKKAKPYMEQLNDIRDTATRDRRRDQILRQVLDIEIGERMVNRAIEANKDKLAITPDNL